MNRSRAAVFLDRDGTLVEERGFPRRIEEIRLLPGTAEALARLNREGIAVVVVTNQSGVARGILTERRLRELHRHLEDLLAREGAGVEAFYYCPHHPQGEIGKLAIDCACRKPAPGLLLQAARDLGLDVSRSCMIGDRLRDVEAGRRAGCLTVLVRTGYGERERGLLGKEGHGSSGATRPHFVAADFEEAVTWFLERHGRVEGTSGTTD